MLRGSEIQEVRVRCDTISVENETIIRIELLMALSHVRTRYTMRSEEPRRRPRVPLYGLFRKHSLLMLEDYGDKADANPNKVKQKNQSSRGSFVKWNICGFSIVPFLPPKQNLKSFLLSSATAHSPLAERLNPSHRHTI